MTPSAEVNHFATPNGGRPPVATALIGSGVICLTNRADASDIVFHGHRSTLHGICVVATVINYTIRTSMVKGLTGVAIGQSED